VLADVHHDLIHLIATAGGLVEALRGATPDREARQLVDLLDGELRDARELLALVSAPPAAEAPTDITSLLDHLVRAASVGGRVPVQLQHSGRLVTTASRLSVRQAVRNLLDNALRAAGDAGPVVVQAYREDGVVVVEVHDPGPGFGSRQVRRGLQGRGLLIAERAVRLSGGRLSCSRSPRLGGACARATFPARGPTSFRSSSPSGA
jgi:signal transduction histidine kinase